MQDTLELVPLDTAEQVKTAPAPAAPKTEVAVAAEKALDLAKLDLTEVALAQFGDWKAQVVAAEKAFDGVVHDVSTAAKLSDVKSLRNRLVKQPRADVRAVSEAIKSKLTKVSKAVGAELEKAVAEFNRVEAIASVAIDAREKELEEEAQRELDRKAKHGANVAAIRGALEHAQGLPSDRIANGIEQLEALTFDDEVWEEFAPLAETARTETVVAMRKLLDAALDAEEKEREAESLRAEHAAQQLALAIGQRAMACMGKPSATVREELNLLELTVYPEDTPEVVTNAHQQAVTQLKMLLTMAEQQEAMAAQQAAQAATQNTQSEKQDGSLPAAAGACASTEPEAAQGSGSGDEGKAAHAEERAAEPTFEDGGVMRLEQPAGSVAAGAGGLYRAMETMAYDDPRQIAGHQADTIAHADRFAAYEDTSIETSEADAIEPPPGSIPMADTHTGTDPVSVVRDAAALIEFLNGELNGKFKSHPKPSAEWWGTLRVMTENLGPRLAELREMFGDEQ